MHTSDGLPLHHGGEVRAACPRCGGMWPPGLVACPACGGEFGDATVIDDDTRDTAGRSGIPPTTSSLGERTDEEPAVLTVSSSSDPPTRPRRALERHVELPPGSVVDDYEIEARIGAGAMGVVYRARHARLGRQVALKVIAPTLSDDPQAVARFEREARALAALRHPNVVDVHAFGALPDDRSYFVMELLAGEPLDERIARGRLPLDEALDVLDQMARGLEAAHAQGIVHRDLKPSNTFLQRLSGDPRRVVKLLDFGLAKLAVADGVDETASGIVIGTALYLSPEQARGPDVDGRADVYALGVVAYELVVGQHPFPDARTPTAMLAAHLTEPPPPPRTIWPEVPVALDLLLHAMIAKDAGSRPTLAQVRAVIAAARAGAASDGLATVARVPRLPRSRRAWLGVLAALVLLAGVGIGSRLASDDDPRLSSIAARPENESVAAPTASVEPPPSTPTEPRARQVNVIVVPGQVPAPPAPAAPPPTTRSTKPVRPHADTVRAVAAASARPVPADAGAQTSTPTAAPSVELDGTPSSDPPIPVLVEPPQRPSPVSPTRSLGRDATINPFAKKGSR